MSRKELNADVTGQSEEYRKGLVLGFTMAEIMLILLFLLLLLLGKQLRDLEDQVSNSTLNDSPEVIVGSGLRGDFEAAKATQSIPDGLEFEQWVGKLIFQSEAEQVDILKAEIEALRLAVKQKDETITQLKEDLGPLADLKETIAQLEEQLQSLEQFKEQYGTVASAFQQSNISQNEGAQCLLECGKKGVPACWGESINNPDFIYDIAMYDDYFWVALRNDNRDRNIEKWNALPDKAKVSEPEFLNRTEFMRRMQGLNEYGALNDDCKFSVRLFDAATSSKQIYKKMRKEVESFAYPATRPIQNWSNRALPCESCAPTNQGLNDATTN